MNEISFEKIKALLFPVLHKAGTFDPDRVLSHFEEELNSYEAVLLTHFLRWVDLDPNGRSFNRKNFMDRWRGWLRACPQKPSTNSASDHDPRVAVTLMVSLKIPVGFYLNHETVGSELFKRRVAELVTNRIEAAGGIHSDEIERCEIVVQEAM